MTSTTKWKEQLLKSSLPLEHIVAEVLAKQKWYVAGQYSYSRKNETGVHADFSVDMQAYSEFSSKTHWLATLNLLIECKYSSPGVRWIFLPYPETSEVAGGYIKTFEQLANKRVLNRAPLWNFDQDIPYCIRGVSIFDSGCDENSITRGINQLRYAMPRMAERAFRWHSSDYFDEDISIHFACPVLVTTAPIYVLKEKLTLEDVYSSKSLEEIAREHEAIILWDSASPDRERYSDEIYNDLIKDNLGIEERITKFTKVFPSNETWRYASPPSSYGLKTAIGAAGDHVLVINYNSLDSYLKKIHAVVKQSVRSIRKFADLSYDQESRTLIVDPIPVMPKAAKTRTK